MTLRHLFWIIRRDSLMLITNMTGLSLGLAASILITLGRTRRTASRKPVEALRYE